MSANHLSIVICDCLSVLQELQLASSPSRRASSPFSCRLSRAGSQTGSTQSLAGLSSTSRRARAEPNSPTSSLGRAVAHSPVSSQGGALRARGFHKSLSARATTDIERFSSYATGSSFPFSCDHCSVAGTPMKMLVQHIMLASRAQLSVVSSNALDPAAQGPESFTMLL